MAQSIYLIFVATNEHLFHSDLIYLFTLSHLHSTLVQHPFMIISIFSSYFRSINLHFISNKQCYLLTNLAHPRLRLHEMQLRLPSDHFHQFYSQ